MKNIFLMIILTFTFGTMQAQEAKSGNAKHSIEVNGNCDQCKKRIEKAAFSVSGVKSANWDMETHQLQVILNEKKASVEDVSKAIAKAGHDTKAVKADKTDYDNLHHCCKYDRDSE